jgi:general secretion pathway protein A
MYAPFFGLRHPPFSIAPDPRYLFMSERHREALAHLLYGLDAGGGFVLLTGEVGAGKTTVCRCFLEQIPSHCNVAYIFNPKLTVRELLRSICDEFGVPHKPTVPGGVETVKDYIDPLNASLLAAHGAGRNTVLIIDEAQNLSADVLEQLRLLTNLETSERKLLQIILIGQPELRAMVAKPSMEQLAQRVIARFHLGALTPQETQQYIAHRMAVAGLQGPLPFDRRAMLRVHKLSHGIPRRINLLCDRALLGAYAAGARQVTRAIVDRAAREVFDAPASAAGARAARRLPRWVHAGLGMAVGAAAVAAAGWAAGLWPSQAGGPAGAGAKPSPAALTPAAGASRAAPAAVPSAAASSASGSAAAPAPASAASGSRTPGSAAAAGSAGAAAAPEPASALEQFVLAQPSSEAPAWQALAAAWGATVPAGADACTALPREGLRCYRNRRAGLNLVRQIDRPVLLGLYPSDDAETPVPVLLRALDSDTATLEGGGRTLRVPLAALAQAWRGDIATLWRAPAGMPERGEITDTPAGAAWLDQRLASKAAGGSGAASRPMTPALRQSRIHRFQLAQGVTPDGRAGPLTLMLLNRAAGVREPRLVKEG